ncbi:hypothetical protein I601_0304 [Nocardioides dokdonensis FR1436]|uniref:Uncharacterized protein n=2 Tax=Nocardioides TaxID=1839 RepID=A0A1A9GEP9_9ACTN|nr:hypothetical protein I601_0304 [Nocardioides dokdonensis FR1436]
MARSGAQTGWVMRVGAGSLLVVSGALMSAASWRRWAGACPWGDMDSDRCLERQDHLYDFVAPGAPWEPLGDAAQLAGWSLLVLAAAFVLLPWALSGRRPGVVTAVAQVGVVLATTAVGVATLRSGLAGVVVDPVGGDLAVRVWLFLPPVLLVHLAVVARGWDRAAAVLLVLATPLVAGLTYAVGTYDARPWWEAVSGLLVMAAGLCLVVASVSRARDRAPGRAADPTRLVP